MKYDEITTPNELGKFMTQNIHYGYLGKNKKIYTEENRKEFDENWLKEYKLESPQELLTTHYGTCWDEVELERDWFTKHNYEIKTIFIWFDINETNNLPTHTFLVYKENNKWYWFEKGGIGEFSKLEYLLDYVKENHYKHAKNFGATPEIKKQIKFYEYSRPPYNIGVDEYIDFVTTKELTLGGNND